MDKLSLQEILKATGAELGNSEKGIGTSSITNPYPLTPKPFTGVTTDSRKITEGLLFVALKGENFNGEDFAQDAINKGAAAVLVSKSAKNID